MNKLAELNVRYYNEDLTLYRVGFKGLVFHRNKAKSLAQCTLNMDKLLGPGEGRLILNPCNISVRGPKGRFVKWKK